MKKLTLIILTIIMIFSLGITAFADDTISDKVKLATPMADVLKELGVFKGSDKGYELERPITRAETMAIIVRLIGKEFEATKYTKNHNFTDVPEWANKYVAFSRDNGLTNGISETKFGSSNNVTARQFLTFIYRALGYYVEYDEIFSFAEKNGLISEGEYTDNSNFTRADVVILINRVLNETYISSDCKVIDILTSPRVPETGFINTRGMGKNVGRWEVGTFSNKEGLPLIDKSLTYEGNRNKINDYLMEEYFIAVWPAGIYLGDRNFYGAGFIQHDDGRYGLNIFGWRKDYENSTNKIVCAILDMMYFISGDEEVAYALWSWMDSASINGWANSDDFGFKDIYTYSNNNFVMIMNDAEIEVITGNGENTLYFK